MIFYLIAKFFLFIVCHKEEKMKQTILFEEEENKLFDSMDGKTKEYIIEKMAIIILVENNSDNNSQNFNRG